MYDVQYCYVIFDEGCTQEEKDKYLSRHQEELDRARDNTIGICIWNARYCNTLSTKRYWFKKAAENLTITRIMEHDGRRQESIEVC